jgi:F420H(2)-dependent quinone reductase
MLAHFRFGRLRQAEGRGLEARRPLYWTPTCGSNCTPEMPSLTVRDRIQLRVLDVLSRRGIYLGRRSTKIHVALYRRSGGRLGGRLPGWREARILLVDHIGARSGTRRTSPLIYHEHGDAVAVVGSKAGQPTNPAWFHNLRAHPNTTIQIGVDVRSVRARLASDEEREQLWPKLVDTFPAYDLYQRNTKGRKLPVVILDPR